MPKLLQINVDSALYSCGKICEDIATVAQSLGWETYIAFGREHKNSISKEIVIGNQLIVYEHYIEHKLFDNEGLASRYATFQLVKKIKSISPDIIHLHVIHDHYLNYPILFNYLSTIETPVVWTQHDCWSFTGGCMYPDLYDCIQWKTHCNKCNYQRAIICQKTSHQFKLKNYHFRRIKNMTFVPVSNWLGSLIKQSFPQNNIITIHNGVNINIFRPQKEKQKNRFVVLGVAAVWDKRKGLNDFIKLRELLPISEYDIVLVGLKSEQIKNLPSGIKGIEKTYNLDELVNLYSSSNVFINPTYSDNFPTTNIEALACGTPVITYNTGGSPEAVDDKTGIIIERGNVNQLASAIIELKRTPLDSADCRKRAIEFFNKDENFKKYILLYNTLLSK